MLLLAGRASPSPTIILLLLGLLLWLLGCARSESAPPAREPLPTPERWYVILDAGHGGFDAGASGTDTGVKESDLNLQVALYVQAALEEAGVRVLMTRTEAGALGATKREDMARRGALLETEGADAAISIHMNKFSDRKVRGPMVYYQAGAEAGHALAASVIDSLTEALSLQPRLPNPGNNFVTRVPACPAALVECGFLSNAAEERLLQDEAYQRATASAIARGVMAYLERTSAGAEALSEVGP